MTGRTGTGRSSRSRSAARSSTPRSTRAPAGRSSRRVTTAKTAKTTRSTTSKPAAKAAARSRSTTTKATARSRPASRGGAQGRKARPRKAPSTTRRPPASRSTTATRGRRLRGGTPRSRSCALLAALGLMFLVVAARLVYVQTVGASKYVAYGVEQRIEPIELAGGRGAIYDRNGEDLAVSIPQTTIAADPSLIDDPALAARRLARVLDKDAGTLREKLSEDVRFVYLTRQVGDDVAERVRDLDIDGVLLFKEQARFNPSGDLAGSVLGSVNIDSVGRAGLEQAYEEQLSGEPGHLVVERDPEGRTIPAGRHQIDPAVPGDDLVLTLDRNLQSEVERVLQEQVGAVGAKGGTAIVSDPRTGEILAMANQETDPETGVVHNSTEDVAVTSNYEPGSVNKAITVAAALEEGLVTPDQVFQVPSALQVADKTYTDAHPGAHTVTEILSQSSNVGTIMLAQLLGEERLDEYLRRFGFGRDTGLGLPHEESGQLLDVEDWSGTSIASISFGQGISVTALQMLLAYNVMANDGVYVEPTLVAATRDSQGERHDAPPGDSHRVVSPTTAAQLRAMLAEVIDNGTGTAAAIDGYSAAGKTGTARKPLDGGGYTDADGNYHYISTFAGFLPADDPELSIVVVIDEPTASPYAAETAAPAFAEIGRHAARSMGVAADPERAPAPLAVDAEDGRVRAAPAAAPTTAPPTTTKSDKSSDKSTTTSTSNKSTTTAPTTTTTTAATPAAPTPGRDPGRGGAPPGG